MSLSREGCDYCGLPVPGRDAGEDGPLYCCYGCRFAAAVAQESGEQGQLRWNLTGLGLAIFFTMNVMVFTLVLWSLDVFPAAPSEEQAQAVLLWDLFRYLSLLFSLPVLLLLGRPLLESAIANLRRGSLGTDLLLAVGVGAAYVYSAISVFQSQGHVYFEVGCMILVAVTLGRWLEATGKWKATDALKSLAKLLPETVDVQVDGEFESQPLEQVRSGDLLRVLAGERIPVDGIIRRGRSLVDEQIVTGESQPGERSAGETVYGGTLNLDGTLQIEATAAADGGSLQRLINAVEEAACSTDQWRRLADRIAVYFTPVVIALAVITFTAHWLVADFQHGLLAGLAVLLIACPCALGVATPLATWAAFGTASRRGVLFRDGDAVARFAAVDTICFDKTGTLTDGKLQVEQLIVADGEDEETVKNFANRLCCESNHVMSRAIASYTQADQSNGERIANVQNEPGRGVYAHCHALGTEVSLGSERFMRERNLRLDANLLKDITNIETASRSHSFIGWRGKVRGVFILREVLRAGVHDSLRELESLGVEAVVLTGDRRERGQYLSDKLGICVLAELLPDDKLNEIENLQAAGKFVAMVGDGVNDAPALAHADVGIALGCGADVSRDAADVCLIRDDVAILPWAMELAKATQRTVRQNLTWAFSYNTIGVFLAMAGWLNPMLAALAMAVSSLLVVSNSLRLANWDNEAAAELPARVSQTYESDKSLQAEETRSRVSAKRLAEGVTL